LQPVLAADYPGARSRPVSSAVPEKQARAGLPVT